MKNNNLIVTTSNFESLVAATPQLSLNFKEMTR